MLGRIFERFVEKSPVSVMARGLLERVLNSKTIDEMAASAVMKARGPASL